MSEYDRSFGAKLAQVASEIDEKTPWACDARRLVVYLSRLSIEITLKALLEQAGQPLKDIRQRSHNLCGLLADLGRCEVEVNGPTEGVKWSSADCLRAVTVDLGMVRVPIGELIVAENRGASKYPNQIRYGSEVIDIDPSLLASTALLAAQWANDNWRTIRLRGDSNGLLTP